MRVIHSGVWGFASSPFVTEDEIKKITAQATDVAKASAVSKRFEVQLAPTEAYIDYWAVPVKVDPDTVSLDDKIAFLMKINEAALKQPDVMRVQSQIVVRLRVEVPGDVRRLLHRAGTLADVPELQRHRAQGQPGQVAHLQRAAADRRLRGRARRRRCSRTSSASPPRRPSTARRRRSASGLKDLIMTPSHAMLTIHEIVAHATELDRIVGYEANYAGTSFVKISDLGKLKYGSKLFNVTADRTHARRHVHGRLRR